MAKQVEYVISVIEPEQEYLWGCPEGTKYIYITTRLADAE